MNINKNNIKKLISFITFFCCALLLYTSPLLASHTPPSSSSSSYALSNPDVRQFLAEISDKHGIALSELDEWFEEVKIDPRVIKAISQPAEAKPWYQYQKIFINDRLVKAGVQFWKDNQITLAEAERIYGVPAEIIIGILGAETQFGKNTGNFPVLDTLTTLSFDYPPRAAFFKQELEHFILLSKEEKFDPRLIKGSYAGAMGKPQFIASSYRHFAVDFTGKGQRDILTSTEDAIGSIANYFKAHGWRTGEPVIISTTMNKTNKPAFDKISVDKISADKKNPVPNYPLSAITKLGLSTSPLKLIKQDPNVALIQFENQENQIAYWLGFQNFYVITRYNHSNNYAMAVYLLGQTIKTQLEAQSS